MSAESGRRGHGGRASHAREDPRTRAANEIEGLERITGDAVKDIEPHCRAVAGLWVPCTGIIDFRGATKTMAEVAMGLQPESGVFTGVEATGFTQEDGGVTVHTRQGDFTARGLVVCAGLQADRLARKDGVDLPERVVGFRGDYYELEDNAKHKVRNLIYPVPNPAFPFLGVHFTRMTNGDIECGPNAVFTFKREGYGKTDFNLRDTAEALVRWNLEAVLQEHVLRHQRIPPGLLQAPLPQDAPTPRPLARDGRPARRPQRCARPAAAPRRRHQGRLPHHRKAAASTC